MELRRRRRQRQKSTEDGSPSCPVGLVVTKNNDENVSNTPHCSNRDNTQASQDEDKAKDAVVGAAVRGGSLLMLLALIQRASTFVLNLLLQRAMLSGSDHGNSTESGTDSAARPTTSAFEEYGAAAITLELISSTALFLAREPFRVALARSCAPPEISAEELAEDSAVDVVARSRTRREAYRRRFVNTAWLSAPIGMLFSAVVWSAYPWLIRNDSFHGVQENRQAATLVCIAAAIELMCEPLALIFQNQLLVGVRVKAEAAAVLVLGVSRYLLVAWAGMGVLSFGYAQMLHSGTLAMAYILSAARQISRGGNIKPALATHTETGKKNAAATPSRMTAPRQGGEHLEHNSHTDAPADLNEEGDWGFAQVRGWLPGRPTSTTKSIKPRPAEMSDGSCNSGDEQNGKDGRGIRQKSDGNDDGYGEWVDRRQLSLAGALAGQSVLKHVLTEGDKIVLARASSAFSNRACSSNGDPASGLTADDSVGVCRGDGSISGGGSLYEQGVYAVASGYGSLAARLLFQPLEEAARLMFSKLGAEEDELVNQEQHQHQREQERQREPEHYKINSSSSNEELEVSSSESKRGAGAATGGDESAEQQGQTETFCDEDRRNRQSKELYGSALMETRGVEDAARKLRSRMAELLATLLKLVLTAGLVFVCFGVHYTETLLRLLLVGRRGGGPDADKTVSQVATVLSWYCVYVLFLAANGMCEAFACAVARGRQLTGMGAGLVASFASFWALVGPLTGRFGTRGLVMANSVGMACRVLCSAAFIRRFFLQPDARAGVLHSGKHQIERSTPKQRHGKRINLWLRVVIGALPHPAVVIAMIMSSTAALFSSPYFQYYGVSVETLVDGVYSKRNVPWDFRAATKHVAVGGGCFAATALVFARFERTFLAELRALWASRR